ncbi:MAG: nucleotide exchange factor GrpE [Deltaproteobacteria bacterium]|nr:nucleotide exchange factor GrpE [Deltaproteobacteria bacterium]
MGKIPVKEMREANLEAAAEEAAAAGEVMPEEVGDFVDPLADLSRELESLRQLNQSLNEQMLRVRADAENFRKRLQREKDDFARFAREGFVRDLLPVKDNLERALAHAEQDPAAIVDGVKLTLEQFDSILKGMGVEVVECLGSAFDPALHEAMSQLECEDQAPNTVLQELQRGYCLHGRLLRPAMVVVARAGEKKAEG